MWPKGCSPLSPTHNLAGQRILLPRAAVARDLVPVELARRGAVVDVVEAYRTVAPAGAFDLSEKPDWITFTSSSTVRNFVAMAGAEAIAGVKVASIGPVTSATAREFGNEVRWRHQSSRWTAWWRRFWQHAEACATGCGQ
jgi:uroporphyrinogen-III synthase